VSKFYGLNIRPLDTVPRVPYRDAFLIGDLLTSRMTFLTGEPKAGKSLFAAAMIRALLEGHEEFIGLPVLRKIDHVIYGYTDDGADEELRERFIGTEAEGRISVLPMYDLESHGYTWADVVEGVIDARPGLFVLDTVLGSLGDGEDISSSVTAGQVVKRVRPISEAGIPVLLVTHTPKGTTEGLTVSSSVIGGRAMAGGVRGVIALRKNKDGRRVQTSINRAREDLDIPVIVTRESPDSEVPVWTRVDGIAKPSNLRADWKDELIERVLKDQPEVQTYPALAAIYASEVGRAKDTVVRELRARVEPDGTGWKLKG